MAGTLVYDGASRKFDRNKRLNFEIFESLSYQEIPITQTLLFFSF